MRRNPNIKPTVCMAGVVVLNGGGSLPESEELSESPELPSSEVPFDEPEVNTERDVLRWERA